MKKVQCTSKQKDEENQAIMTRELMITSLWVSYVNHILVTQNGEELTT